MSYYCEVCNGMSNIQALCPQCHQMASDLGRYNDYMGPYAPYRPIDDLSMTNGFDDLIRHVCIHMMNCEHCGQVFNYEVQELRC
jgi:hypothetical protein